MDSIQTASNRRNVQGNAIAYLSSQTYLDDQAEKQALEFAQFASDTENVILNWCNCNNDKDLMAPQESLFVDVPSSIINANVVSGWISELNLKGYNTEVGDEYLIVSLP